MDHFHALRDLGIEDPALDRSGENAARATMMREIEQAVATPVAAAQPCRRRRRRLQLRLAVPAIAGVAAATAAVVVIGGLGEGSSRSEPATRITPPSSVHGQDTAFIVRRARAALADGSDIDVWVQAGGNGVHATDSTSTTRSYTDPQSGVAYQSSVLAEPDGTEIYAQYTIGTPIGGHRMRYETTAVDPQQHLDAVSSSVGPS